MSDHIEREFSGEIRRTKNRAWAGTKRHNYVGMSGRVSVSELLAYLEEHASRQSLSDIYLNWMSVVWVDDATPDELAEQAERERKQAERTESWERKRLAELLAKYGDTEPTS